MESEESLEASTEAQVISILVWSSSLETEEALEVSSDVEFILVLECGLLLESEELLEPSVELPNIFFLGPSPSEDVEGLELSVALQNILWFVSSLSKFGDKELLIKSCSQ
ncbi:hypothetical protein Hamer_G013951 [Homarus americanus]|uniref:Uncharacterized protein n=1 Tax=Homarus americanus TaxID=6706 RepID=A0A8J5JUP7_HOMAM|nr:hypothetical protein Hamer_G013951 [Homarus americanus]